MKGARLIALVIAVMIAMPAMSQKLYRWVDEDGNVHYSDQVPPEAQQQARDQVTQSGRVVDSNEAAGIDAVQLTPEELELQKKQMADDEALARKYASEDDIVRGKQQKVAGLELSIRHAVSYVERQTPELERLQARKASVESDGGQISDAMQSMIQDMQSQLAQQKELIDSKSRERDEIVAFYDGELDRYRAMLARKESRESPN